MAEGRQDHNLWEVLPFHSTSTITVLSWNIRGKSGSKAEPRNLLVPRVVDCIDPDVLLLQEIPSDKIIKKISCQTQGRTYVSLNAGNRFEARVMYDSRLLEPMPEVNLDGMVDGIFPPEQGRQMRGVQRTFRSRVAAVRLRHIDTGREIVFLSFHNIYKGRDRRGMLAGNFCQIVAAGMEPEDTLVVGGADLNCNDFYRPDQAHIPGYNPTERRRGRMIDYFVARNHANTQNGHVSVRDIFNHHGQFSQVWRDLKEHMKNNFLHIKKNDFKQSLDHDPLVYELSVE